MIRLVDESPRTTTTACLYRSGADLIALGLLLRLAMALAMPCISKDGALYCWFARDLGRDFAGTLASGAYQQHPLFSTALLGVQRSLLAFGLPDDPASWQIAGQIVSFAAGALLLVLCGELAAALRARIDSPADRTAVRRWTLSLMAVLPLGVWLSADVMTDQLHALFYVAALVLLVKRSAVSTSLAAGALSGLAYLVRPEAIAVPLAGVIAGAAEWWQCGDRRAVARAAALLLGFAALATPYAVAIGQLSPKQDKHPVEQFVCAGRSEGGPTVATLAREQTNWYESVGLMLYHTGRAGRVVIPVLGVVGLWRLRRFLAQPGVNIVAGCLSIHATLVALLQWRAGYLDPRHTLISVLLLLPFAATAAVAAGQWLRARWPGSQWVFAVACVVPLAGYALRVPNAGDAFVSRAAVWLVEHEADASGRVLLGGSSERRIAFYADLRLSPWNEYDPDDAARLNDVRGYITHADPQRGPHFFAIQTSQTPEGRRNALLLEQLLADPGSGPRLHRLHAERSVQGETQHLFRVH